MPGPAPSSENSAPIIETWRRLAGLKRLCFEATPGPGSGTGWRGHGEARIEAVSEADGIRLHEHGRFVPAGHGRAVAFRNVYHWQRTDDRLSLAHERFGRERPVPLFELAPAASGVLACCHAHHCGADRYRARLELMDNGFDLIWHIAGPIKDEHLRYRYRG